MALEQTNAAIQRKQKTIFFPASYLIMTLTSLALLAAVSGLGAILIDYWLNDTSDIITDFTMTFWIASLVIITPIHLLFYWQVRRTDRTRVTTFSLRIAHGLLGLYLLTTVVSAITFATWLIALWLNVLIGTGVVDSHLYAASLALLQAIAWSFYATWHFTRVRSDQSKPLYYIIFVSFASIALVVASLLYPAPAYREVARDFVKETDLGQLQQAVNEYVDEHSTLPRNLNDLHDLDKNLKHRLGDYHYTSKGGTELGIFAYELCATFAKKKETGRDTGWNFASHDAGKQCFTRFSVSGKKLQEGLEQYVKNMENGAAKLQTAIKNFLAGAEQAVQQEVTGVETYVGGQFAQLETHLEGLEGGTVALQQEMIRLEGNLSGLEGNTTKLNQDFDAVGQFFHNLLCGLGLCERPSPNQ